MGAGVVYPEEAPVRRVNVDPFYIDATEVTNRRFSEFVGDTGYVTLAQQPYSDKSLDVSVDQPIPPGSAIFIMPEEAAARNWWEFKPGANWQEPEGPGSDINDRLDHPVVHIAYQDAASYAEWVGGDLPTEIQWEFAARGGIKGATFEWGEERPHDGGPKANTWQGIFPIANTAKDGYVGTAPVGCFKPNGYGLYDMTGNVWEWVKEETEEKLLGTIKGGSYLCADNFCRRYRPAAKHPQEKDFSASHIGFRVVYNRDPGQTRP